MDAVAEPDAIQFVGFRLDRRRRVLLQLDKGGDAAPANIGARALDVLWELASRPGDVVSRSEIMDAVWPGVTVEESNLAVQISTLRRVIDAGRTEGSCIQTIPGRGYRFVLPVRPMETDVPPAARSRAMRWLWWGAGLGAIAAVALVAMIVALHGGWFASPEARPRLSIVVLPFANLSGDPNEDYLADGITDDLTSDISRMPGSFVIARQSAQSYRGKTADVRTVGAELGVRYVVEGSVRKMDDVLRVNVQLIATETGAHLWADRFDQPLKSLSTGQEEIVRRIGQTLNVAVVDTESARSKRERPTNPDAFDLILRARSIGLHPMGPREQAERTALYEQALQLDPTSLPAMLGVANSLIRNLVNFDNTTGGAMQRADRLIAAAAAINPDHPEVLDSAAWLLRAQDRYQESIAAYQHLVERYPNYYTGYGQIGMLLTWTGHPEQGIPIMLEQLRRAPQIPGNRTVYDQLGYANLLIGKDAEAIFWLRRALAAAPNIPRTTRAFSYIHIAEANARLGHLDEARDAIADANRAWPYDTVRAHFPEDYNSPILVAQIKSFQAALRLAGHRDHAREDADFGAASDDSLPEELGRPTPTSVPGARTIYTAQLQLFLTEHKPIIIDTMMYWWGRSLPGAIGLKRAGAGGSYSDAAQDRLRQKMQALTNGDLATPIVATGFNSERIDGRNLALRLVALGYTNVYWYRGGREAWEVAGLPESTVAAQDW